MFMGNYIDEKLSSEVYRVIDSVIESVLYFVVSFFFLLLNINHIEYQ